MIYRVGQVNGPRDDDPTCYHMDDALTAAREMSEGVCVPVIAVWRGGEHEEIVALVYEGRVYLP